MSFLTETAGVVAKVSLGTEHQGYTIFPNRHFCFLCKHFFLFSFLFCEFTLHHSSSILCPFKKVEVQFVLVKKTKCKISVSRNNGISICFMLVVQEILFCIRKPSLLFLLFAFAPFHNEFKYLKPKYGAVCVASTTQPCHTCHPHQEDRSVSTVGRYGNWIYQFLIWKDGIG